MFDSTPPNLPVDPASPVPPMEAPSSSAGMTASSGRKEPEDIFENLDMSETGRAVPVSDPVMDMPPKKSPFMIVGIVLAILVVLGGGGFTAWYFLHTPTTPTQIDNNTNAESGTPRVVVTTPEPVVEKPIVPPPSDNVSITPPANAPSPQPIGQPNTPPPAPPVQPSPEPAPIISVKDTDADGLTDVEEVVLRTDTLNPDTDGDGFKDGDEMRSGYDPTAPKQKISDAQWKTIEQTVTDSTSYPNLYPLRIKHRATQ